MKLSKDLREFVALLTSHNVEYVLVGGHAVAYHGYPRYTGDTDFLIRPTVENAQRVLAALSDFGFGDVGIDLDDLSTPGRIVQLGLPPNRIDLITRITGVSFDDVWKERETISMGRLPVPIIGRRALIANKRATGRTKDLADVDAIEDEPLE